MKKATLIAFAIFSFITMSMPASFAADEVLDDATQQSVIDINVADVETLAANLEGVGRAKAEEIVAYRQMYGKFATIDELLEVKGIGIATLEKNRHRIHVGSE